LKIIKFNPIIQKLGILVLLIWFFAASCTSSYKTTELTGDIAFEQKDFIKAAKLLEEEYKTTDQKEFKAARIASCYEYTNKYKEAGDWYQKSYEINKSVGYFYKYIDQLKSADKLETCIEELNSFLKKNPTEKYQVKVEINNCERLLGLQQKGSFYTITKLDSINTYRNEYSPSLYLNKLVFTSDRNMSVGDVKYGWTGEKFVDFYISNITPKLVKRAKPFNEIFNTENNDGACTFNKNGTEIFFTRCGSKNITDDYCSIYTSTKVADNWLEPEKIIFFENDSTNNIGQPFLSEDGKALFFSSDAAGSLGGKDIWVSYRKGNSWSTPKNLGSPVNTSFDEMFPSLRPDGTLFFSSNKDGGIGGLDIYYSKKTGGKYLKPVNLQCPINSGADDFSLIFKEYRTENLPDTIEATGFFCSSRVSGKGGDDIYQFIAKKTIQVELKGYVVENIYETPNDPLSTFTGTQPVANAQVQLFEYVGDKPILIYIDSTSVNGGFNFIIQKEKNYKIIVNKKAYFSKQELFNSLILPKIENDIYTFSKTIIIDKVIKDKFIEIPNIFYDLDKYVVREDASVILDSLVLPIMNQNPELKFELGSHTDSRGNDDYNEELSQKRADAVVSYLINKGIDAQRLTAKGYGETQIINKCKNEVPCEESEHEKNRRTTFRIIED
jgi:peptidoglycan-associated lipoprotein